MACSDNKNPLQHGGTSQQARMLAGLNTAYIKVDERGYDDWIVFANAYSGFLKYFNENNEEAGNWNAFFTSDISSLLGSVAVQNINVYREQIKERFDYLKNPANKTQTTELETKLNELFSALLTLSKAIDEYYLKLPENIILKNTLLNLIKKLSPLLKRFIAYYKSADSSGYITTASFNGWCILNKDVADAGTIINNDGLSNNWIADNVADWQTYTNNIIADGSIFQSSLADAADDEVKEFLHIQHAASHNLFSSIFDQYLFAYTKLINDATNELEKTLNSRDDHQPHYALFLSFLKLFKFAQDDINTITKRHLDFYYKEILRLQPKPAAANHAHILIELAKQVDGYLLAAQTQFKAGKDSKGKDVLYELDTTTTFNKAKVASLKNIYIASNKDDIKNPVQTNQGRLFASSVTNSDDGLGAALTTANKEWQPFINKKYEEGFLQKIAMPEAQIGFAIASHYLYLTEGERKIYIKLVLNNNNIPANTALDNAHIECYLTTEKKWYKVESNINKEIAKTTDTSTSCTQISFTLSADEPPIVNYNAAIHGGTYNCALPVIKMYLIQNDEVLYDYDALKAITISKAEIKVEVGMDGGYNQKGLKNLLLANDFGTLDASKPFMPFGSQPNKDAGFIIGSKEVFSKKNAVIKLNIEWAELPGAASKIKYETNDDTTTTAPKIITQILAEGVWKSNSDDNHISSPADLFNGINPTIQLFSSGQSIIDNGTTNYQSNYTSHNASAVSGFIKLSLESSFGNSEYIRDLSKYFIERNPDIPDTITKEPKEPYTPKIKSIYLSYSAYTTIEISSTDKTIFDNRDIKFFNIYPFGEAEQHAYINAQNNNTEHIYLLPRFVHKEKDDSNNVFQVYDIGELYIGIQNLQAKQAVNILFQVMEGTTDPKIRKPENHAHWSFLSNNQWLAFEQQQVSDATLGLLQSGIISFTIPALATTNNTILPPGYLWLMAGISSNAEAVCKLISVDAQAAVTTYQPNNNADDFLDKTLAASIISKLKIPDAAVKTITQPYSSFGGRPKENEDHFYIRVSERLKHKARAITIWDYEHLILEAFPEIYKVKCLNHTSVKDVNEVSEYNQLAPGNVAIITIPLLTNRNDANPLKPFTNQDTLTKIENYLQEKVSCFVTVKARQPQFEEVRIMFKLKLHDAYTDFTFYSNKLKEEITQYLTPWANNSNAEIQFGGRMAKSSLINFIEERFYVDYITEVRLFQKINDTTSEAEVREEAVASGSVSILVSAPASKHVITQADEESEVVEKECENVDVIINR